MFLRNYFFHCKNIFKMVVLQSTFTQGTTAYTGTPTDAFKPIGGSPPDSPPQPRRPKSRRLKFVNSKFTVPIKNSSGRFCATKPCTSFPTSNKVWLIQVFQWYIFIWSRILCGNKQSISTLSPSLNYQAWWQPLWNKAGLLGRIIIIP